MNPGLIFAIANMNYSNIQQTDLIPNCPHPTSHFDKKFHQADQDDDAILHISANFKSYVHDISASASYTFRLKLRGTMPQWYNKLLYEADKNLNQYVSGLQNREFAYIHATDSSCNFFWVILNKQACQMNPFIGTPVMIIIR